MAFTATRRRGFSRAYDRLLARDQRWYTQSLRGRPLDTAMLDLIYSRAVL